MRQEEQRETRKPSGRRKGNIYDRLEEARAARAKVLATPTAANDAGTSHSERSVLNFDFRERASADDAVSQEHHADPKPQPQEAVEKVTPKRPERIVPEADVTEEITPDATAPEEMAPEASVPEEMAPEASVPEEVAPEASVSEEVAPEASVSEEVTPAANAPEEITPDASLRDVTAVVPVRKPRLRTSRSDLLPELTPADFEPETLPEPARRITPRRVSKDGFFKSTPAASASASFVAPDTAEPVDPDAELRASISKALRDVAEVEPVARPRRGFRFLGLCLLVGSLFAGVWGWTTLNGTPPQLVAAAPASVSAPAVPALEVAPIAATTSDVAPDFAAVPALVEGLTIPQSYQRPTLPWGPEILSNAPVLATLDAPATAAAPTPDTSVARGTVTRLPTLASN